MKYGLIYDSANCHITGDYLRKSIPESQAIHFDLSVLKSNAEIEQLLETTTGKGAIPDVILHEIGAHGLPRGLDRVSVPTGCLDIDTFGWTRFRLSWAMLFDYVFTWHPSYVQQFQEAGHPRVFAIPHAVDGRFFAGPDVNQDRFYDVGFVGNFGLPQYSTRDRVNSNLAKRFQTNDFLKKYSKEEMAEVYKRSRIIVNVSRNEFPHEANMRCYEAMAAGALLITGMPTELTEWGFLEGEHFIGWHSEEEIPRLVDQFLHREEKRPAIALAGQERTLKEFTYQRCVETMANVIERDSGRLFAPARQWSPEMVHLLYLSYYHRFRLPCAALEEFRLLRRANPKAYWRGLPMVLKTLRHAVKSSLM
jgi:Glycosyl transferases group 1